MRGWLVPLLVAGVVCALLQAFVGRVYMIPSESMTQTLLVGDRIVAEKVSGAPHPGDVTVFAAPASWDAGHPPTRSANVMVRGVQQLAAMLGLVTFDETDMVKRVIATGGHTVRCCDAQGRVEVDGMPLHEPYVRADFEFLPGRLDCGTPRRSRRCFTDVTVPPDTLWMMGDNRSNSRDSRYHVADERQGCVPLDAVRGIAVARLWPPTRWRAGALARRSAGR